ncbi:MULTISPECIES: hypothetical protein [unclassified Streptomyces]|uniref:hypothetical protein n=1 Tax=unclassified Streptomyces TaxID=2593676 RepID=UPI0015A3D3EF|nr:MULTISPECIES: hypothetical protein [unclassified Streptomyces]
MSDTDPNQSYAETRESFSSGISWCSAQHLGDGNRFGVRTLSSFLTEASPLPG